MIITRRPGEWIKIGKDTTVKVTEVRGSHVKIEILTKEEVLWGEIVERKANQSFPRS